MFVVKLPKRPNPTPGFVEPLDESIGNDCATSTEDFGKKFVMQEKIKMNPSTVGWFKVIPISHWNVEYANTPAAYTKTEFYKRRLF